MVFGIVYIITCVETGEIYVGSTTGSINQRMAGHVCNCNRYDRGEKISNCSAFNIIRRGNYKVCVLEHIEFNHKLLLLILYFLLLVSEILNTSIEKLADKFTKNFDNDIKNIKDLGSAAVFLILVLLIITFVLTF